MTERAEEEGASSALEGGRWTSSGGLEAPRSALPRSATGAVAVYAAACGVAGAVPLPYVDAMLGRLARGAAMRRVASRRGVRLGHAARDVLARPGLSEPLGSTSARLVRSALVRFVAPVRIAARAEDAIATFLAALVLDHYLATADRRAEAPVDTDEAIRVRAAMEKAWASAGLDSMRGAPGALLDLVGRAGRAAMQGDSDGRGPVERFVDAVLDGVADVPSDLMQRMCDHFDAALAEDAAR